MSTSVTIAGRSVDPTTVLSAEPIEGPDGPSIWLFIGVLGGLLCFILGVIGWGKHPPADITPGQILLMRCGIVVGPLMALWAIVYRLVTRRPYFGWQLHLPYAQPEVKFTTADEAVAYLRQLEQAKGGTIPIERNSGGGLFFVWWS